eukprot:TRINITY_DN2843_c0_g1_i1.p1 TRINITY_DN2843_c0_g1~~TRINITY_DN2843_c0_g1_i1.p1  ORF type:complete len:714 (-),score=132.57 TRINITY_DN2843_c0_g1_i1:534-2675(-)
MTNESSETADVPATPLHLSARPKVRLYLCVLAAACSELANGYDIGAFSFAILHFPDDLGLSTTQTSVVVSMFNLVAALGCLVAGPTSDAFGRKTTLVLGNFVNVAGTILLLFSNGFVLMFIARFIMGIGAGIAFTDPETYASELSPPAVRGITCAFPELFINLGLLIGYLLGYLLQPHWRAMVAVGAAVPFVAMMVQIFLLPETPRWLVKRGRPREAARVLLSMASYPRPATAPPLLPSDTASAVPAGAVYCEEPEHKHEVSAVSAVSAANGAAGLKWEEMANGDYRKRWWHIFMPETGPIPMLSPISPAAAWPQGQTAFEISCVSAVIADVKAELTRERAAFDISEAGAENASEMNTVGPSTDDGAPPSATVVVAPVPKEESGASGGRCSAAALRANLRAAAHDARAWKALWCPGPWLRRAMIVGWGIAIFQQITGSEGLVYFSPTVLRTIGVADGPGMFGATMGVGLAKTLFVIPPLFLIDRWGRKPFLLVSAIGVACCLLVLGLATFGTHIQPEEDDDEIIHPYVNATFNVTPNFVTTAPMHARSYHARSSVGFGWASAAAASSGVGIWDSAPRNGFGAGRSPVAPTVTPDPEDIINLKGVFPDSVGKGITAAAMCLFLAFFSLGFGPLTGVYLPEMFPLAVRGAGVGVGWGLNRFCSGIVALTFIPLVDAVSVGGAFLFYFAIAVVSVVFVVFAVPETRGMSIESSAHG